MKHYAVLSDTLIRNIKPGDARKRLSDGNGLYLLPSVKGGSHGWRLDYTFEHRRKTISLGIYPDTSLKIAREKAAAARALVAAGQDPSEQRKAAKDIAQARKEADQRAEQGLAPVGSFEDIARQWYAIRKSDWADSYGDKVIRRLEVHVFPWLGKQDIRSITPPAILEVLRRIEASGSIESAHRTHETCSRVFRYAISIGQITSDPTRDLRDALRKHHTKHMPAIVKPSELASLLRAIDGYRGSLVVRTALRLAPMLLTRPGELRFAKWSEIDLEAGMWTIPSSRMKREKEGKTNGEPHYVPLATQAVELLRALRPLTYREDRDAYVFHGERDHERAMSENTINAALRRMGYDTQKEVTGHGFRATARTILDEHLQFDEKIIEAQLAHSVKDSLGRAYNRTEFMVQRRKMMQSWADYLQSLQSQVDGITASGA